MRLEFGGRYWLVVDLVVWWIVWCGVFRMEFCGLILIFDLIFFFGGFKLLLDMSGYELVVGG